MKNANARERAEKVLSRLIVEAPYLQFEASPILPQYLIERKRRDYYVAMHLIEDALNESCEESDLVQGLRNRVADLEAELDSCELYHDGEDVDAM